MNSDEYSGARAAAAVISTEHGGDGAAAVVISSENGGAGAAAAVISSENGDIRAAAARRDRVVTVVGGVWWPVCDLCIINSHVIR